MAGPSSSHSQRSTPRSSARSRFSFADISDDHFPWRGDARYCERASLNEIAQRFGTPTFVYSQQSIAAAFHRYQRAFRALPTTICYAVKANSNLAILKLLAQLGSGFDIVSGGELYRLRQAGIPRAGIDPARAPSAEARNPKIVFSGVGKTREEIREALREQIFLFNVESLEELDVLLSEASRHRRPAPAAIRVNPNVEAGGHAHISTGRHHHKFGMNWADARRAYLAHKNSKWIAWKGISAHIGSQLLSRRPIQRAARKVATFVADLQREGVSLTHIDFGGGLGVRYTNERPIPLDEYARIVTSGFAPLHCRLLLEPGRSIIGPAGALLMRVLYTKTTGAKNFIVVDAAMNDFIRPALYGGVHPISHASRYVPPRRMIRADIVGPVCESGDCLLHDWPIEEPNSGDLLVLWGAGAYGFSQSSNYNSRPRAAEVLVNGNKAKLIRKRESRRDLVRGESPRGESLRGDSVRGEAFRSS